jgi:hypothetical protein
VVPRASPANGQFVKPAHVVHVRLQPPLAVYVNGDEPLLVQAAETFFPAAQPWPRSWSASG